jgi:hypothetical protein
MFVPDELVPDLLDAFDAQFGGRGDVSKGQWAKRQIKLFLRQVYVGYKGERAGQAAFALAYGEVEVEAEGIEVP